MIKKSTLKTVSFLFSVLLLIMISLNFDFDEIVAKEFEPMFPFVISYDNPQNASSVSHFLDGPSGKYGFVRVKEGRFHTDQGEIRFNATNITGPANFPSHENAEKIAERFARLGINCVRLHFMDTWYVNFMTQPTQGILADDTTTQRNLDPKQLDKLDFMINAFKKRGIYINLNLHVGRTLDQRDGFPNSSWANKGFDQFVPGMIKLQKEYARQLLTHVNKYTGNPYTNEPTIAMIEITNEDSFQASWFNGSYDFAAEPYRLELQKQWNKWLHRKYKNTTELEKAWQSAAIDEPLTNEQFTDGSFENDAMIRSKRMRLHTGDGQAKMSAADGVLKLKVSASGSDYCPKLYFNMSLKKGKLYTLSFRIRRTDSSSLIPWKLSGAVADIQNGWKCLGWQKLVTVGKKWVNVNATFYAQKSTDKAFLQLTRFIPGEYELDDLSLKSGGKVENTALGFAENKTPLLNASEPGTGQRLIDFGAFLDEMETRYWLEMYNFIKKELKTKSLVYGTQCDYSAEHIQAKLDFTDGHAYWRHPSGGWISLNAKEPWKIGNDSMVNSLSCILSLANRRVQEKPFTVSEYNHPYPNQFGAESQPFLAIFGRLQGWSGIFQYSYNHYVNDWAPQANPWCFFDSIARTEVLAHFPACSAAFLRGDISPAKNKITWPLSLDEYAKTRMVNRIYNHPLGKRNLELAAVHAVESNVDGKGTPIETIQAFNDALKKSGKILTSDTGEIVWNREIVDKGYVAVNSRNTKIFTGFPEGRTIDLGEVKLKVGPTRLGWTTLSMFSRNGNGFGSSGKTDILLAATGDCGNAGRVMKKVGPKHITLTDRGHAPVMAEGINATLTFSIAPERIKCYALNSHGDRTVSVPVIKKNNEAVLVIDPKYKTVWYEIVID